MNELKLNITYYKVLETIYCLNEKGYYPLNEGIYKILTGKKDDETLKFATIPTYSTLISYTSKKICNLTLMLYRYKFIDKIFDKNTNDLYFRITELGTSALKQYLKNKKDIFVKKSLQSKTTIVKIG